MGGLRERLELARGAGAGAKRKAWARKGGDVPGRRERARKADRERQREGERETDHSHTSVGEGSPRRAHRWERMGGHQEVGCRDDARGRRDRGAERGWQRRTGRGARGRTADSEGGEQSVKRWQRRERTHTTTTTQHKLPTGTRRRRPEGKRARRTGVGSEPLGGGPQPGRCGRRAAAAHVAPRVVEPVSRGKRGVSGGARDEKGAHPKQKG